MWNKTSYEKKVGTFGYKNRKVVLSRKQGLNVAHTKSKYTTNLLNSTINWVQCYQRKFTIL